MINNTSNTQLKNRMWRKTNPQLGAAIYLASKTKAWMPIAKILSQPTKHASAVNLSQIDKETKAGDIVIIPGRVLSRGDLTKKLRICSLGISESAREKIKKTKSEYAHILEEIKKNPKAEGIKIIR